MELKTVEDVGKAWRGGSVRASSSSCPVFDSWQC